jgi:hypothetical protein
MIGEQQQNRTIACLAWGSLVWDRRQLPISGEWFKDGPLVPVEFSRQSDNGRITLVIDPKAEPVRVLWAHMLSSSLADAQKALRDREGIRGATWLSRIGSWRSGDSTPRDIPDLPQWAKARGLDGVIWTALAPKFGGKDRSPSADEVIAYLRRLSGTVRDNARQYVEKAPLQIDTIYRREIEAALGWSSQSEF